MAEIAILVEGKYVNPKSRDWYIDQALQEDQYLIEGFERLGLSAQKVDWSTNEDWSKYRAVVFSSIWDYFYRFEEFQQFLIKAKGQTLFINDLETINWNIDKHYLADLEKLGIPIVPSYFIEKGDQRTLTQIYQQTGWDKTVIKPCVSGAARHTYILDNQNLPELAPIFRELISKESMILQPFQEQILTKGEVSHIVINGSYTHSVLKKAKPGDYRVQDDFGGTVENYTASKDEISFAEQAVKACSPAPLYARVDVVWDNDNNLALGELELVEPELWFRKNPKAAYLLAESVFNLL